ncbi:DUF4148 domain-containing protein [Paraburkholderia sp. RL17-347-BIC-D]|uniref:DUF4148 domain-containing protein n=1 Tax=Paraburkholderia sp. RL17-347-BIC-D TaxID=3031632 RepID=UPI0038BC1D9D
MRYPPARKLAVLLATVAVSMACFAPAFAQSGGGGTSGNNPDAANPVAASKSAATTKAQRKAARKEARAKKNAELKQLESNGYNPGARNDTNYPQNLQNAQKKAGSGAAASQ